MGTFVNDVQSADTYTLISYSCIGIGSLLSVYFLKQWLFPSAGSPTPYVIADQKKYSKHNKDIIVLHIFPRWKTGWPHIWKDELYQHSKTNKSSKSKSKSKSNTKKKIAANQNRASETRQSSADSGWSLRYTNGSPFCVKLEALLTYYGFNYIVDEGTQMSNKNKAPWITYYNKSINKWVNLGDSQIIIETLLLQENNGSNFEQDYKDDEEILFAHSLRTMLEESLYWNMIYRRWMDNGALQTKNIFGVMGVPSVVLPLVKWFMKRELKSALYGQGTGRHRREEVYDMFAQKVRMIMNHLKGRLFIFGDEMTSIDCIVFAFISNVFEPILTEYRGFEEFMDDENNPLIKYNDDAVEYCTRVRLELETRRVEIEDE